MVFKSFLKKNESFPRENVLLCNNLQHHFIFDIVIKVNTMNKEMNNQLLTRKEVANYFKIDLSTLHRWTKNGKLKAYGKEGRVYYKRSEIESSLVEL